jgi:hypothetical protein
MLFSVRPAVLFVLEQPRVDSGRPEVNNANNTIAHLKFMNIKAATKYAAENSSTGFDRHRKVAGLN